MGNLNNFNKTGRPFARTLMARVMVLETAFEELLTGGLKAAQSIYKGDTPLEGVSPQEPPQRRVKHGS